MVVKYISNNWGCPIGNYCDPLNCLGLLQTISIIDDKDIPYLFWNTINCIVNTIEEN